MLSCYKIASLKWIFDLKTEKTIFILLFLGIALTIISTIRFETESVQDLVVTRHGFPFSWFHQNIDIDPNEKRLFNDG